MKILVCSAGTHGDLQPAVALAKGLLRAGHDVHFASHEAYAELIVGVGLTFRSLQGNDPRKVMRDVQHGTVGKSAGLRLFKHLFRRQAPPVEMLGEQLSLCREFDVVLSAIGSFIHAAEATGTPCAVLALYPILPTRAFPHHLSRIYRSIGPWPNWLTHFLIHQMFWFPDRTWVNGWRGEIGLDPVPWTGPSLRNLRRRLPHFFGYSPLVIPKPYDWGAENHVCGYWFLDSVSEFEPDVELLRFLEQKPAPLVVAFGSIVDPAPEERDRMLADALKACGERAVVLGGWNRSEAVAADRGHLHHAQWIPLPWLLPKVRGIIHHGGAGTVSEAIRAGVPSVVIPYSGEQKFWGNRLYRLRGAPPPIPRMQLSDSKLSQAIRGAFQDSGLRNRMAGLSRSLRAEDGVANAIAAFEAWAQSLPARSR
jgi:sterol 3beta-glucosyltransferase